MEKQEKKLKGSSNFSLVHTSIPSSTSTVVSNEEDDSMDKTPSGPTLSIASAIMVPIASSCPVEILAMAAMSAIHIGLITFFL